MGGIAWGGRWGDIGAAGVRWDERDILNSIGEWGGDRAAESAIGEGDGDRASELAIGGGDGDRDGESATRREGGEGDCRDGEVGKWS